MQAATLSCSNSTTDRALLDAFHGMREELLRTLRFMLGNPDDAQDALQAAFLRCWRARDAVPELRNLPGWIWRVGLNAARDYRDYVRRRRSLPLDEAEDRACPRESPPDAVVNREQVERLREALTHLRPAEQEVFLLRHHASLSYEEIARRRGCPVGTAKTQMRAAVTKLRRMLEETAAN